MLAEVWNGKPSRAKGAAIAACTRSAIPATWLSAAPSVAPDRLQQDHEFVAAEAGDEIGGTDDVFQPPRHPAQELVADMVALGVVEHLELVEVDEEKRMPPAVVAARPEGHLQSFHQRRAVGQAGQRIAVGEIVDTPLGLLALGDVGEEAVPEHRAVGLALRHRLAEDPAHRPALLDDPIFRLPRIERPRRSAHSFEQGGSVVRMDEREDERGVVDDLLGGDPEDALQTDARVRHRRGAVGPQAVLVETAGDDRGDFLLSRLDLETPHRVGNLAHGAVIVARRAGAFVTDETRAFLDPDALARPVAVHLGEDVSDLPLIEQHPMDLGPAAGIDVPLPGDIVDLVEHLVFAVVAVEVHERRIRADHVTVEGGAEHTLGDVVVEVAKTSFRLARRQVRGVALHEDDAKQNRKRCQRNGRSGQNDQGHVRKAHAWTRPTAGGNPVHLRAKSEKDD